MHRAREHSQRIYERKVIAGLVGMVGPGIRYPLLSNHSCRSSRYRDLKSLCCIRSGVALLGGAPGVGREAVQDSGSLFGRWMCHRAPLCAAGSPENALISEVFTAAQVWITEN